MISWLERLDRRWWDIFYLQGRSFALRASIIQALDDSIVAKFPVQVLVDQVSKDSQHMLRVVQLIMMWIHRVLFVALFNFLGLSQEIFVPRKTNQKSSEERNMSTFSGFGDRRRTPESTDLGLLVPDRDFRSALADLGKRFQLDDVRWPVDCKIIYPTLPESGVCCRPCENVSMEEESGLRFSFDFSFFTFYMMLAYACAE